MERLKKKLNLTKEKIIGNFFNKEYFCYMTGFIAGMPFLGDLNENMRVQRLETPRVKVPKGSVGITEQFADIYTFEKTNVFKGLYHVLGGVLSPLDGVGPDDLNINSLIERVNANDEILVATNATIEGEATCLYLANLLESKSVKVTRLARGLPIGGDLEFVDDATIMRAIEDRSVM